jgi:hypothetical protein
VLSLVVPCAPTTAMATLTVSAAQQPVRLPEDKPEPKPSDARRGFGRTADLCGHQRLRRDVERECKGYDDTRGKDRCRRTCATGQA